MKMPETYTDSELVTLLNQDNQKAFAKIYNTYAKDLFRLARKNISSREECEEIIQDVFESLWSRRSVLKIDSISSYLRAMVKHKIIDHFKKNKTQRKYLEHYMFFEITLEISPDENLQENQTLESKIDMRISELPERCQVAMRLRLAESMSNSEIARRMNITKKTVERYMYIGFAHLRKYNTGNRFSLPR